MQRVPNTGEAECLEILDVGGGKLGDTVGAQGERHAGVDDAANGEIGFACPLPDFIHHRRGFDKRPVFIGAKALAVCDRFACSHGSWENRGVSQFKVKFHQHQLADGDIRSASQGFKKTARLEMKRRRNVYGVNGEVGIK